MKINIYETIQNIFRKYRNQEENNIDYENAMSIFKNDKESVLVDVRSPQEYKEWHINGSINIPLYDLEKNNSQITNNKNNVIIVYCQTGKRSKKAVEILKKVGYTKLYEIDGGLDNI